MMEVGRRRRRRWGRAARSSQRGVPAEDDLQLSAVQFASVRQSHDALLVPQESFRAHGVHVLPQTTRAHIIQRAQSHLTYSTVQRQLLHLSSIFGK